MCLWSGGHVGSYGRGVSPGVGWAYETEVVMSVIGSEVGAVVARATSSQWLLRLLLAMIGWLVVMQIALERSLFPPIGLIQAAFLAVPTVLVARRWRHGALTASVFTAVMLLAAVPSLVQDLGDPGNPVTFVWNVVALPLLVALVAVAFGAARASRSAVR